MPGLSGLKQSFIQVNLFQKDREAPSSCEIEYLAIASTPPFGVRGKSVLGSGSHVLRLRQEGGRAGRVVFLGWCLSLLLAAGSQQPVSAGVLPVPPQPSPGLPPFTCPHLSPARWPCSGLARKGPRFLGLALERSWTSPTQSHVTLIKSI